MSTGKKDYACQTSPKKTPMFFALWTVLAWCYFSTTDGTSWNMETSELWEYQKKDYVCQTSLERTIWEWCSLSTTADTSWKIEILELWVHWRHKYRKKITYKKRNHMNYFKDYELFNNDDNMHLLESSNKI